MWWWLRAQTALLAIGILAGPSCAQAPGDEQRICTELLAALHPVYPNNVKRLMDTADYENLITGRTPAPVWQTVNADNNPNPTILVDVSYV